MNTRRTTLYKDKSSAKLLGVCAGLADYTGINVLWVRLLAVFGLFLGPVGGMILLTYLVMGWLLNNKPTELYSDRAEQRYWQGVRQNPKRTAREIRARFKDIDRRLADVESHYVSSNPRLNAEIERLR